MTRTIISYGETGSGKSEGIRRQGGKAIVKKGHQSDTKIPAMYTIANGDHAIDTPGLQDTRVDAYNDDNDDAFSDQAHLRSILNFLSQNDIRFVHGIQWHIKPDTRVSKRLECEARFIHELVGKDGWNNVVVLTVASCVPAHITVIENIYRQYAGDISLPIRGVVFDHPAPKNCVCLDINEKLENSQLLANLRRSSDPIEVCALNEECVKCRAQGDHRTYGPCHADIDFKHGHEVIIYDHSGTPVANEHIEVESDGFLQGLNVLGHAAMAVIEPATIPFALGGIANQFGDNDRPSCRRAGCDGQAAACYYVWNGCGCEESGHRERKAGDKGGCFRETRTCGYCGKAMEEQGCIGFCRRCKRHQADEGFARHGCAPADVQHDLRRRD